MDFDIAKSVRLLAKSDKYQSLYVFFKEGSNINLFMNQSNYTDSQITFLNYLSFYNTIYTDIYLKEVGEIVLEDFVYEDAYMYYKRKVKDKEENREKGNNIATKEVSIPNSSNSTRTNTTWVFKKPKKG